MADERVAIITGSGKGIGRGIARRLAADGVTVVLNYAKDEASAQEALSEVRSFAKSSVLVQADVSTADGAKHLIDETLSSLGRIDVLVNNVGPFLVKSLFDTEVDEWQHVIDGNLSSVFYCCKFALPSLRARQAGNIVNIGSLNIETQRGAPTTAAYNSAKAGLVVLTKSLARSEARHGVRCNIVNPGFIETYSTTEADRRELPSLVPLGRLGTLEDVAEAVAFLVSEKARYVTGAVLNVHGGLWV